MKEKAAEPPPNLWPTFSYFEIYQRCFGIEECSQIIDLHRQHYLVQGKIASVEGRTLRDSDLFWIPQIQDTAWIFSRLREVVNRYNSQYGFELTDEMGQAQLTRYKPGQHYEWHMDLGAGQLSLRKLTAVVQLTPKTPKQRGGIEVFYGQSMDNKLDLDSGDMVVFPSFVMHRALMADSETRWSLVSWLNGENPLR